MPTNAEPKRDSDIQAGVCAMRTDALWPHTERNGFNQFAEICFMLFALSSLCGASGGIRDSGRQAFQSCRNCVSAHAHSDTCYYFTLL